MSIDKMKYKTSLDVSLLELDIMTEYILKHNDKYEILTPSGFKDFGGVRTLYKDDIYTIQLSNGKTIKCSSTHPFISNGAELLANEILVGDTIDGIGDKVGVVDISFEKSNTKLYDVVEVDDGNIFYVDGIVSHNCDFISSGEQVIDAGTLQFYKETHVEEPLEKGGFDGNLWKWEYPDYTKSYMVVADVARGDASDFSTAHVIDVETVEQVAEYRGQLDTKDFGNFLVSLATDYNNALLVIENSNIGWATIQQVIDRGYGNLFYMSKDLKYVDVENQLHNKYNREERNMVAGFSTNTKTRPLIISKLNDYFRERTVKIRSVRTIDELFTFIWKSGKAQAMRGYNDDLTMALAISLWVRDTALRLRQEGIDLTKNALDGIDTHVHSGVYGGADMEHNPWRQRIGDEEEDLTWLL